MIREQIRSLILQADALGEQATALGMQAETMKRSAQAALASLPAPEPVAVTTAPPKPMYFNQPSVLKS